MKERNNRLLKISSHKWHNFILLGIILVAIIFRFYNFPMRYGLGDETVRDAVIGIEGARQLQLPLTGSFSSAGSFTFGPWFYYQMILAYLLIPSHYSPWIYLSAISVLCVLIGYKIGEYLDGKFFGLTLGFLIAISPAQILSSTHLTSPNSIVFFALLAILIFIKMIKENTSYWWGLLFGLILGIGINIHYQMASLLVLILLLLIFRLKRWLYSVAAIFGVGVTFIPLLLFDLTNHWFTLKNILFYYLHGKNAIYVPNRWLFYLRDFWPGLWADTIGVPKWLAVLIILSTGMLITYLLVKKKLSLEILALAITLFMNFILFRYYWGERFFGYFVFMRPFIFIFTALPILYVSKLRYGLYGSLLLLGFLSIFILPKSLSWLSPDSFSVLMYKIAQDIEMKYPDKRISLYSCTEDRVNNNAVLFSLAFLLDYHKKLSDDGVPVGLSSNNCKLDTASVFIKNEGTHEISSGIIDLSSFDRKMLVQSGWKSTSFKTIYDSTARWWFREQP